MDALSSLEEAQREVARLRQELRACRETSEALRRNEAKYRRLVEKANEAILVAQAGFFQYANPKAEELFGHPRQVLTARPLTSFVHPDDREMVRQRHAGRTRGEDLPDTYAFRIVPPDSATRWVELKARRFSWHGQPAALCFIADITPRIQAEKKYQRALASRFEGFLMLSNERIITEVNQALLKISGYRPKDFIGHSIDPFYAPASVDFYSASPDHFSFEALFRARDGRQIPMLFSRSTLKDENDQATGFMYFLTDLTGLYNTRYLYRKLDQIIAESQKIRRPFSLVFMDMDNFKQVVDTYGHLNGSQALKEVAATIRSCLQKPCFGVAYGGDEFVIVLPGYDKPRALRKLEQIRTRMGQTLYLTRAGLRVHLGASFGVATFPDETDTREGLLALADQAMFRIKQTGKGAIGQAPL